MTTIVKKKESNEKVKKENSQTKIKYKESREIKKIEYLKKVRKRLDIHCLDCGGDMN
jgi:hypothetical protein